MIKKLGNDILQLNEALCITKRSREDSHGKLFKLIESLESATRKELERERIARAKNEEILIRFLDETVNKSQEIGDFSYVATHSGILGGTSSLY